MNLRQQPWVRQTHRKCLKIYNPKKFVLSWVDRELQRDEYAVHSALRLNWSALEPVCSQPCPSPIGCPKSGRLSGQVTWGSFCAFVSLGKVHKAHDHIKGFEKLERHPFTSFWGVQWNTLWIADIFYPILLCRIWGWGAEKWDDFSKTTQKVTLGGDSAGVLGFQIHCSFCVFIFPLVY